MTATETTACRSCGSRALETVLDLGEQPLANALRAPDDVGSDERRYPLAVALCPDCSLLQLTHAVAPELLFSNYPYFSSFSSTMVEHARTLVLGLVDELALGPDGLALEIASNDGYLLRHYRAAGVPVLGIEPAANIAAEAVGNGIPTLCEFFSAELGRRLRDAGTRAQVVHAHNVMAHVPDLNGFVEGVASVLAENGRAVIETPYVKDLVDRCEFDTIYHEHVFYYSLTAVDTLFGRHGLAVERVERVAVHGGSLRIRATHADAAVPDGSVQSLLDEEQGWHVADPAAYADFAARVSRLGDELRLLLRRLKREGASIAAYGAAAKGSTLLNTFEIGAEVLDFVVDRSPHKQGRYMPGTSLPIYAPEALLQRRPDYVLLLPWNLEAEILEQQREYRGRGGRFIIPVPEPRVVET
jgi:SAM-dependent methyltransferase